MTIQQFEQLNQGQRRLDFAILIAREGIDAATEQFSGLPLFNTDQSITGDESFSKGNISAIREEISAMSFS